MSSLPANGHPWDNSGGVVRSTTINVREAAVNPDSVQNKRTGTSQLSLTFGHPAFVRCVDGRELFRPCWVYLAQLGRVLQRQVGNDLYLLLFTRSKLLLQPCVRRFQLVVFAFKLLIFAQEIVTISSVLLSGSLLHDEKSFENNGS